MDAGVRSWRPLLTRRASFVAACACWVAACAGRPSEPVGLSHGDPRGASAIDAGVAKKSLDVLPADFRVHMKKVMHLGSSQHALGRFEGDVWSDETSSMFVEEHRDPSHDKALLIYVMKKQADGWQWFAQDETGVLLDDKTNTTVRASCASCHADAPKDGVFLRR